MSAQDKAITVWVIEDNTAFRESLAEVVDAADGLHCAGVFGSFEEARPNFRAGGGPEVLLLDLGLPGINGIEALERLRVAAPQTKIVVLTAFDDDDKIFRAVCAGASGYLLKTARLREIPEAVRQAAEGGAPITPSVAGRMLKLFSRMGVNFSRSGGDSLTPREREVLGLMAEGLVKKEIADRLDVSVHTVVAHLRSIYEKLHVNTNTAAVAKAIRHGLV